jgi:DNA-binding transcriptional regulator YiaG
MKTKTKIKNNSKVLEAVYDTMSGFHSIGIINDEQMNEFREGCLEPEPVKIHGDILDFINKNYGSNRKKLEALINDIVRKELKLTQTV